ncbi:MAG: hypothetical protein PHY82_03255, partial [Lentisphaeria bacterium]|nr:hypothetical protein [Lentisphaeria bacterium]
QGTPDTLFGYPILKIVCESVLTVMRQLNLVTEEFFLTTKSPNRPEKISWETVLLEEFVVHPMKFFRVVSVFRCKKTAALSLLTDYFSSIITRED